ncbi:MAG: hypothetical protein M1297_07670 [Nitrospirae bacterium]|jgi:hypothetical protein|uniref:Uncharacterized protein n=1 Tax=Leptospirillum ferriphilum YSK TaxID=1441628 RepID=A0A059XX59_9BACT|nr:hypothetical protein [Leptospirillum ferriphilum]AIA31503.1 hypothetical protein Y981_02740 [Leptospirillum ferriphilum YSK]MCL4461569.1 hypothetical protein [Nitrospirota bacterium]
MVLPEICRSRRKSLSPAECISSFLPFALDFFLAFAVSFSLNPPIAEAAGKLGGILVHIEPSGLSSGDLRLLIDRVPLTAHGTPLCRKPSGKLFSVLAGNKVRRHREHSTFVVIPERSDPLPEILAVGDCLTIDGRRNGARLHRNKNAIRIVSSLSGRRKSTPSIRAFSLRLWPEEDSSSSSRPPRNIEILPGRETPVFPGTTNPDFSIPVPER